MNPLDPMNILLAALLIALGILFCILMTRRDQLKRFVTESSEVQSEVVLDKYFALLAVTVGALVALLAVLEIDLGWFSILEVVALLITGAALVYRLQRQHTVLAKWNNLRNARRNTKKQ